MELLVAEYGIYCIHQYTQQLNGRIFFDKGVELVTTSWVCAA